MNEQMQMDQQKINEQDVEEAGHVKGGRRFPWKVYAILLVVTVASLPLICSSWLQPIAFNERGIQESNIKYGVERTSSLCTWFASSYRSGLGLLLERPERTPPSYKDQAAMFDYVFSFVPPVAHVYPTEGYYYYSFDDPKLGRVCGSIRTADFDKGYLVFNYFRTLEGRPHEVVSCRIEDIDIEKLHDYRYRVVRNGREVEFRLTDPDRFMEDPVVALLPEEKFVSRVFDESGLRFLLLFNERTVSFYYLLDDQYGVADTLEPLDSEVEGPFWFAKRTGFVFYRDEEVDRDILVGVSFKSILENDFFDGPGDQVPFRLPLRPLLHLAYPSTAKGEGIDLHGLLLTRKEWARYLISAYHEYTDPEKLRSFVLAHRGGEEPGDRFTALTKEWWHTRSWRELQYHELEQEGVVVERKVLDEASRPDSSVSISRAGPGG